MGHRRHRLLGRCSALAMLGRPLSPQPPAAAAAAGPSVVVELDLQHEPLLDLAGVVHDELVVEQRAPLHARGHDGPEGHLEPRVAGQADRRVRLGCRLAPAPRVLLPRLAARGRGLVLGGEPLVRAAEAHLREEQHARGGLLVGEAVVGRLGGAVGEVDALAEHVAGGGRLGRRDAQTLRENAHPVGEAAAVPEQHAVLPRRGRQAAHPLREGGGLPLAHRTEDVLHLEAVGVVRGGVGLGRVLDDHRDLLGGGRLEAAAEALVVGVVGVLGLRLRGAELLGDGGRRDREQRLDHVALGAQLIDRLDDGRRARAVELVRDRVVELVGERHEHEGLLPLVGHRCGEALGDVAEHLVPGLHLLVGDGAEGHLLEVDVGLAQLLLHHLLAVDERDEGGHLRGERARPCFRLGRTCALRHAARGRLPRHLRRVLRALAREEGDVVAAGVLARRLALDEGDGALLAELVVELLERLAQPLLTLAVLVHQVAARLRPTPVAALLLVTAHAAPAAEDGVLGPLGRALQQLDLPELVHAGLDVELVAHGVVREVVRVDVDLDAALGAVGVDLEQRGAWPDGRPHLAGRRLALALEGGGGGELWREGGHAGQLGTERPV
mmetsp:Transcript_18232/g.45718  ORF Transcript_18232/g.45718 Transcript_18232/m.45718 type:complete len:610 (-) Transcript_18232:269-2098(-)